MVIAPLLVGVCGTDLELIDGTIDPSYVHYPLTLDHEWVGRLEQELEGVGPAGTRVVVEGIVPCGVCLACRHGATNLCEIYDEVGFTRAGAIANHISVPAHLVHQLGADVEVDDAVLIEPMAVVWRALTRMPLQHGLNVAIIGDGTIAMLAAHLVRLFDPSFTIVFGRRDEQRDIALLAGADEFSTEAPNEAFDLVIEASRSTSGVATSIESCARGGMVILLGLPSHGAMVEFSPRDLQPSFLITHRFDLETSPAAVTALRGGSSNEPRGKVVIEIASS